MKKIALLGLLSWCVSAGLMAQSSVFDTPPALNFESGKALFADGKYAAASHYFQDFLAVAHKVNANAEQIREAQAGVALSAYHQRQDDAQQKLLAYMEEYPYASDVVEMNLYVAILEYEGGQHRASIKRLEKIRAEQLSSENKQALSFYKGCCYVKQKKFDKAKYELSQLLNAKTAKNLPAIYYYYGYSQYRLENYHQAAKYLEMVKDDPEFKESVRYLLPQVYFLQEDYDQTLVVGGELLQQTKDDKKNAQILRMMGTCFFKNQQYPEAIEYLERYKKVTRRLSREDWYNLGIAYYKEKQYDAAIGALSKVTGKRDLLTQNAYFHIAMANLEEGNKKNARLSFEAASRDTFDVSIQEDAWYNYALVTYELSYQPFNESVEAFEGFLQAFPNSIYKNKVYGYLVNAYLTTTNYAQAYASIQKIKTSNRQIKEAEQRVLYGMATTSIANRKYTPALKNLELLLSKPSYNEDILAKSYFWYGECLFRAKRYQEAEKAYQNYVRLATSAADPEYNWVQYNLGYVHFQLGNYAQATEHFRKFVQLEKTNKGMQVDACNRIGDGYFQSRNFDRAIQAYNASIELGGQMPGVDYAWYQKAFVQGLQHKDAAKIASLDSLLAQFPKSAWVDDALFEKGRAYVALDQNEEAIAVFEDIAQKFRRDNPVVRQSQLQIAMLRYNMGQVAEALAMHKKIIALYPKTEEAAIALQTSESILVDQNRVDEYTQLAAGLGGVSSTKEDSLQYKAAEKIYFKNQLPAAEQALNKYLKSYPTGKYHTLAQYYLANTYYQQNKMEEALPVYQQLLTLADNPNQEVCLARASAIAYDKKMYAEALGYFTKLEELGDKENKKAASLGVLRCASVLQDTVKTRDAATQIIDLYATDAEMVTEALYNRAQAATALKDTATFVADWQKLAADTRTVYGAEAKYQLAAYQFAIGNAAEAEKEVFDFINVGTPHQHWLAKAFILLSDIYMSQDNAFEAKQYLLSLRDNYDASADAEVSAAIEQRLTKIQEKENEQVTNNTL